MKNIILGASKQLFSIYDLHTEANTSFLHDHT